jgi:hypothetical protein
MEKHAGWNSGESWDKRNFLNFSAYDTVGLAPDKITPKEHAELKKTAAEKIELEKQTRDNLLKFAESAYTLADAFIKYDRANTDVQSIFSNMCKEGSVAKHDQVIIKKAMAHKITQMKEYKMLPDDYQLELALVDHGETDSFSLGNFGFAKKAAQSPSNASVPVVVTDTNKVLRSVQDLVDVAKNMQKQQDKVRKLQTKTPKSENKG